MPSRRHTSSRPELELGAELVRGLSPLTVLAGFDAELRLHYVAPGRSNRIVHPDFLIRTSHGDIALEYDGAYFHFGRERSDCAKTLALLEAGAALVIRVRESDPACPLAPLGVPGTIELFWPAGTENFDVVARHIAAFLARHFQVDDLSDLRHACTLRDPSSPADEQFNIDDELDGVASTLSV